MLYRLVTSLLIVVLVFSIKPVNAFAQGDVSFEVSVSAVYDYTNSEYTQVAITNTVTNLKQSVVLGSQFIKTGFNDIWDVNVTSQQESLDFQTATGTSGRDIEIDFTGPIVGRGNSFSYTVSFKTLESLENNGLIREIYIPKVERLSEYQSYQITVVYPNYFGEVSFASPAPYTLDTSKNSLTFANESCYTVAMVVFFGNYQIYNFDLTYDLENPTVFVQDRVITLPPIIAGRQEVIVKKITPTPKDIYLDTDGNTQAVIKVKEKSTQIVKVSGLIKVINHPIDQKDSLKSLRMSAGNIQEYTKPLPFWEVDDPDIKAVAKRLTDNNKSVLQKAKSVFDFVTQNITYDSTKQSLGNSLRLGAVKTLEIKKGVCMEFSDLTIALLRALSIPAREIDGFAYSKDLSKKPLSVFYNKEDDFLHSWVEFYDPSYGWIPIDPTWGATSGLDYFNNFDSNHVSLVIKGKDSTNPLPPGYFRSANDLTKKVNISFATNSEWNPNESLIKNLNTNTNLKAIEILGIFVAVALCVSLVILAFQLLRPHT